jgi:hypothetical protein
MAKKYVYEILSEVAKAKSKADKVKLLKQNESWALKDVIRGTLDTKVTWNLPEGAPPYQEAEGHNHPTELSREYKQFAWFVKGGKGDQLTAPKRERIFIGLLEGVHPEDAKVLIDMINKKTPKGLTRPVVEEAFPGLLRD